MAFGLSTFIKGSERGSTLNTELSPARFTDFWKN